MTPDYALSLSVAGIELLHRTARGWRRLGRVDVGSETLDQDLADLLERGEGLEPDGVITKLIIPADQIKYTAIDSTQTTQADIDAVLHDATPYGLDELVVDCERFGGRTHIAAVARETLAEAESFAAAHGFNPVCFVGIPEPFTFQKEVFFGPTTMMPDVLGPDGFVDRDALPVMIVGTRIKSRLLIMDDTLTPPQEEDDLFSALPPPEDVVVQTPVAPPVPEVTEDRVPVRKSVWIDTIPAEYWQTPVPEKVVIPEDTTAPQDIAEPDPESPPAKPVKAIAPQLAVLPLYDRVIAEFHPKPATASSPRLTATPKPAAVASVASTPPVADKRAAPEPKSKLQLAIAAAIVLAGGLGALAWTQSGAGADDPVVVTTPEPAGPAADPEPVETVAAPAEPAPVPEVAPARPVTELATLTAPQPTQSLQLPTQQAAGPIAAETPATPDVSGPDSAPQPQVIPPPRPLEVARATPPTGVIPSPAEAEAFYAATGVWQRAPRFIDVPSGAGVLAFTPPDVPAPPDRVAPPTAGLTTTPEPVLPFSAPANPPAPGVVFPRDENGFIAATPEGTLTPEGAVVIAGAPDFAITLRPTLTEAQLARMALLAPATDGVAIVAGAPPFTTPLRPDDLEIPEPAADQAPAPQEDVPLGGVGLAGLELQQNGSLALDTEVVEANAQTDLRPQLRPNGLVDTQDVSTPDITDILTEIAAQDATLRFDNSTNLAVRQSVRPSTRPGDFGTIVAAALRTPPQETPAPAAAAAAPRPAPPISTTPLPGGVARAATQEDVIRLRDMNLIGVYGRPNARRALVRLSNGRYVRVEVGSALDGGQVTAIGDEALNYVKRGRTYAVEMPGE